MTAVFPVGNGRCIALGYESVLPLVLLTLQGGDLKPYEFPTEGSKAMAGTGVFHSYLEPPGGGRGGGGRGYSEFQVKGMIDEFFGVGNCRLREFFG